MAPRIKQEPVGGRTVTADAQSEAPSDQVVRTRHVRSAARKYPYASNIDIGQKTDSS